MNKLAARAGPSVSARRSRDRDDGVPHEIAPGVHWLGVGKGLLRSNVYFVRAGSSWALVDAGSAKCAPVIRAAAESLFGEGSPPASILLTHDHPDHAGAARELAREWHCLVWVHPDEMPLARGDISTVHEFANPLDRWIILPLLRLMGKRRAESMVEQASLKDVARPFDPACGLPGLPDWEAVLTPGHTPGHVAFFRRADRVLITGDALVTAGALGLSPGRPAMALRPARTFARLVFIVASLQGRSAGGHPTQAGSDVREVGSSLHRCRAGSRRWSLVERTAAMRPAKVAALGAALFLVLIGLALLVSGGVLLWAHVAERDSSGFYTTSTEDVSTETYALTTPDANVHLGSTVGDWAPADVRIRAESRGTAPLFIGIGPTDRVSQYLANVAHDEITDFGPLSGPIEYRRVAGVAKPAAPGRQDFWVARQEGSGLQTLEWPARSGNWTAVIMNGDASAPRSSRAGCRRALPDPPSHRHRAGGRGSGLPGPGRRLGDPGAAATAAGGPGAAHHFRTASRDQRVRISD